MTEIYSTYWIHLPEHTDILTQGYVGITKNSAESRFKKHRLLAFGGNSDHIIISRALRKYDDRVIVDTLCYSDKEYAKELEFKLRPKDFIGWNMRPGGMTPPSDLPDDIKIEKIRKWKISMEGKWLCGDSHPNFKDGKRSKYISKVPETAEEINFRNEQISLRFKDKPLSDEHKALLSLRKLEYFQEFGPWANSQANTEIWKMAHTVHELWIEEPCGDRKLSRKLGIDRNKSVKNMITMFKSGWIPLEDGRYRRFINES